MDSLTQIALGAAVGEVVLGKKVGGWAMLWGAVAGTIPDLDIILKLFTDDILYTNEMHRGFSHSILFSIIFAPIFGWLVKRIHKGYPDVSWKEWGWLMFWCLFTHPLLDVHTTWGTQLLWPLDTKFAYNNIFVVDPLYTLPLIICCILALRKKKADPARRKLNWWGIGLSSFYMVLTLFFKWNAHAHFKQEAIRQGIKYNEISTNPTPFNSLLWAGTIITDSTYYLGHYSILDSKDELPLVSFKMRREEYSHLNKYDKIQRLIKLSREKYLIQKYKENEYLFYDIKFGKIGFDDNVENFVFCYHVIIDETSKVPVKIRQHDHLDKVDMKAVFEKMIERMMGN